MITSTTSEASARRQLRIVVVEGSEADAAAVVAALGRDLFGCAVAEATTLAEGLRLVGDRADVIITELELEDAHGLAAVRQLRAAAPDTALIVLTGAENGELGIAAMVAGADDFLVKGAVDGREVTTAVQYALHRRRTERTDRRFERLAVSLLDAMESPTCAVSGLGEIIAVNAAWATFRALGAGPDDVGRSYVSLCESATSVDPKALGRVREGLAQVLDGSAPRFELDYASTDDDDTTWFSVRITPLPDNAGAVLSHVDVTVAKRAEQALAHQTLHDSLTDLPNRDLLANRLSWAMASASRQGLAVGVAFLDLDQFKRINDSLGHYAGDELLVAVAKRLRNRLRPEDTLARFAGDEFVVVWPELASTGEAEALAERLRGAFTDPFQLEQATVTLSASIGIALGASPQLPDELLLAADAAMYDAKSRGRGRTRLFSSELREGAESRLRIEAEIRTGLELGQFALEYQPVVDLRSNRVTGVEALVRWDHPEGRRLPDDFIPVAEASGLIVPLGAWVLQQACHQAAAWRHEGLELDVAVNLSVRQVSHPDVVSSIARALAESGLEPRRLMLEVTESAVLEDAESAQVALAGIAAMGVKLAIDDFGTGYSSLLYLKRYPVGALKVDRSFVGGMSANNDDHAIVTSVVSLARAVGSSCIAEGVETPEQHASLKEMGCDYAQGYLFGAPVPPQELRAAVAACEQLLHAASEPPLPRLATANPDVERFVLERIEQMHLAGASLHTIAAALNREHAPHPESLRWHSVMVAQIVAGEHRPTRRRRAPSTRARTAAPTAAAHRSFDYEGPAAFAAEVGALLSQALEASEAVIVLASPEEQAALAEELARQGHDLDARSFTSQYRTWDAASVVREVSVDGYVSARLFRSVVGQRVETALARFGRARVVTGLAAVLWAQGDVAGALAVEDHWHQLASRLSFDLVCSYPRGAVASVGTDGDRSCLHDKHRSAA